MPEEKMSLETKLKGLINEECRENESNTPDFLLAEFTMKCLDAFELISNKREAWYGVELEPGCSVTKDDILGAVARGWCQPATEKKIMDVVLANAITDEIIKILPHLKI